MAPARSYLVPRLWGSPALLTLIVLQATLSGAFRDTRAVLRLVVLGASVNAVLTPLAVVLCHGGAAGAAWATTAACYASAAAAWQMLRGRGDWLPRGRSLARRVFLGSRSGQGQSKGWAALRWPWSWDFRWSPPRSGA